LKIYELIKTYFKVPVGFCILAISIFILEQLSKNDFSRYGIYPRSLDGLLGILLSPFLHGGWEHLISNMFSITFLLMVLFYFYEKVAISVFSIIWLCCGILVWLFGKENTYHIGASGIIYGLIGFIFFSGIFRSNNRSLILAFLVLVFNGGFLAGFVPKEGISWESHFWGMVVGVVLSFALKNINEVGEEELNTNEEAKSKYFPSDIFTKTKLQRAIEEEERRIQEEELRNKIFNGL
jgi:membrane associated rhomboid family serine protease